MGGEGGEGVARKRFVEVKVEGKVLADTAGKHSRIEQICT